MHVLLEIPKETRVFNKNERFASFMSSKLLVTVLFNNIFFDKVNLPKPGKLNDVRNELPLCSNCWICHSCNQSQLPAAQHPIISALFFFTI